MYKLLLKPLFFLFDPEFVHHTVFKLIKLSNKIPGISNVIRSIYVVKDKRLERHLFGLNFPNPVGLAAGFDKDAKLYHELSNFGFGFIEIGTLTPKPQDGNPKKRMFRLTEDKGLINRLGFNNEGVESAINRLKKNKGVLIGGNIGKNKTTPNRNAVKDYVYCFNMLFDFVDYFVVKPCSDTFDSRLDSPKGEYIEALDIFKEAEQYFQQILKTFRFWWNKKIDMFRESPPDVL